jgi:hypothetical protein
MRKRTLIPIGLVAAWWLWPTSDAEQHRPGPQAAVLADGYAVIEAGERRITEYDSSGEKRAELTAKVPHDARVVGLPGGVAVVYRDGKKVAAAAVEDDGTLGEPQRFGKNVQKMCEQTATNDKRFGVAWTEADGVVWFVHGPTTRAAEEVSVELARQPSYCGIASAGANIALLWRDGDKTMITWCGKGNCQYAKRIALDKKRMLIGFGCKNDGCLIATRNPDKVLEVSWVTGNAKVAWTKPLPSACSDSEVSIVGTDDAIAVAYSMGPEPIVSLARKDGTLTAVWQSAAEPNTVPSIVWSERQLFAAYRRDGRLATAIIRR